MDESSDIGRMRQRLSGHPTLDAFREGSLAHRNFPKLGYGVAKARLQQCLGQKKTRGRNT